MSSPERRARAETTADPRQSESVNVLLTRDQAEELCWAYCGHEPAQESDLTRDAISTFRLAARWPDRAVEPIRGGKTIVVRMPREEAEAMGFDTDHAAIDRVLERIEHAL